MPTEPPTRPVVFDPVPHHLDGSPAALRTALLALQVPAATVDGITEGLADPAAAIVLATLLGRAAAATRRWLDLEHPPLHYDHLTDNTMWLGAQAFALPEADGEPVPPPGSPPAAADLCHALAAEIRWLTAPTYMLTAALHEGPGGGTYQPAGVPNPGASPRGHVDGACEAGCDHVPEGLNLAAMLLRSAGTAVSIAYVTLALPDAPDDRRPLLWANLLATARLTLREITALGYANGWLTGDTTGGLPTHWAGPE